EGELEPIVVAFGRTLRAIHHARRRLSVRIRSNHGASRSHLQLLRHTAQHANDDRLQRVSRWAAVRRFGLRSLAGLVGLAWMAAPTFAQEQPPPSPPSEVVWRWFDECSPRQTIHLELLLDGESIYAATFPACAVSRDAPDSSARQKLTFSFLGRTDIFGEEHATRGTQRIEGILWKA